MWGEAFDLAQRFLWQRHEVPPPDWRSLLRVRGNWLGGIRSADPQPSHSAHLFFCRWLLLHGLQQDGVLDRYDRFIVTRSDFVWLCPHPPMSVLDRRSLWIPDGQWYGGLTDRHLVVSREDVATALSLIDDILLRPGELYKKMKHRADWNPERYLALHLARKGLLPKVKLFPYVMGLRRRDQDAGGLGEGRLEESSSASALCPGAPRLVVGPQRLLGTLATGPCGPIRALLQTDTAAPDRSASPGRKVARTVATRTMPGT